MKSSATIWNASPHKSNWERQFRRAMNHRAPYPTRKERPCCLLGEKFRRVRSERHPWRVRICI